MRTGDLYCLNCEKGNVDFSEWRDSKECPLSTVFNFDEFRKHENYFAVTKPEERHGLDGVVDGYFYMNEKFTIAICTQAESDEDA
jgi:endonuclease I